MRWIGLHLRLWSGSGGGRSDGVVDRSKGLAASKPICGETATDLAGSVDTTCTGRPVSYRAGL